MAPEYFEGQPFGYINGLLGVSNSIANFNEDIYGYKYFCDGLGLDDDLPAFFSKPANLAKRGVFSEGAALKRHYQLEWGGTGYSILVFNYAVYANYDWPVGTPPIELNDFPITTANSQEAFCTKITEIDNNLYYATGGGGGTISLEVEAWDWQGNIQDVTMETAETGVIPKTPGVLDGPGTTGYSYKYSFTDIPGNPTAAGDLDIIVTVIDPLTFGGSWFLGLLGTSNPLYNKKLYNCYIHTATVINCPPPAINEILPPSGWVNQVINATIKGIFIDGPDLGVKLTKTGQDDIIAGNVILNGGTGDITCTIDLTGAAGGGWTLVVTNGCGTDGSWPNGFTVLSCEGKKASPPGPFGFANHFTPFIHYNFRGTDATRASATQYLICTGYRTPILYRIFAYQPKATTYAYMCELIDNDNKLPNCMAIDSKDRLYYRTGIEQDRLVYIDFLGNGFGPAGQPFGTPVPWGTIRFVTIDNNDNPVVLCYSGTALRIYPWTGSAWGAYITVPTNVMSDNGNTYANINDFEHNPVTGDYIITTYYHPPKIYAINTSGSIVFSDEDVWDTGASEDVYCGVYIDRDNPGCRIIFNGAPYVPLNGPHYGVAHFARCNPIYGEWTYSTTDAGDYPFSDARGSVVKVDNIYYFCGTSSYRWYSTYIEVPEW
jgi:hypothetical protein